MSTMKILLATAIVSLVGVGTAAAASDNSNREAAQKMADAVSGTPGIAKAAAELSGNKNGAAPGDSGWGNIGSRATTGDQVSRGN